MQSGKKPPHSNFSFDRASFIVCCLAAVSLFTVCFWVYTFFKCYISNGEGVCSIPHLPLNVAFAVALLCGPPLCILAFVFGIMGWRRKHETHRRKALACTLISAVELIAFSWLILTYL